MDASVAVKCLKQLVVSDPNESIVFSPASISVALGMILAGAKGTTFNEIKDVLGVESEEDLHPLSNCLSEQSSNGVTLSIANKVYLSNDCKLIDAFSSSLRENYKTEAELVDFKRNAQKIRRTINEWVEEVTNNVIKNLIPPAAVSNATLMILVNAIYFKGLWDKPFQKYATSEEDFFTKENTTVKVQMMRSVSPFYLVQKTDNDPSVLMIPYKGNESHMIFILPPKNDQNVNQFINNLTTGEMSGFLTAVAAVKKRRVNVKIPKFRIEFGSQLKEQLEALGIKAAFSSQADFSGMVYDGNICVSEVIHKAFIEVDEEGTEAAASTAVAMVEKCAVRGPPVPNFHANRPFVYAVVKENIVLFFGTYRSP